MSDKKVSVHLEGTEKGEEVEVLYLGLFANGATHNLTDEQVAQYEQASRTEFPESGYLIVGNPVGPAQKNAAEENIEEAAVFQAEQEKLAAEVLNGEEVK